MDPRQRLALELAWELFEDAFVVPETLRGEQVVDFPRRDDRRLRAS